ncbi:granulocyte-macrophage colony-stimulating factor receptor subunit alpha isoform X1 [Monodelphis domestica]|uniref:granulocyte-macrophage colony-stimulating factor receptor subunit alpha isoform X1 n=1 Tax=Monodelphis domestica TaxID=13616 RepID=UPI0024E22BA0|nr:granulocyte-macrophage colony-stimulating factor receptor subunit alpha isoform X1 [Monodelphis domestica]XP_007501083.2 granulocyte-macrophage colony-stimulating factor receptor subunit alpha isoform X1 [Monodelphis domestica]XP_016280302.2 granulocyte-macrophage colony-stimulating factor receptor subunit alpha isoform X1 [Monodelphis domestica]
MADLVALIYMSVLWTSACCLKQEQEELSAKVPGLSVTVVNKDPRKTELTWDNTDNITTPTYVMETHNSPVMDENYIKKVCCHFSTCRATFMHYLAIYQNTSKREVIFNNIGEEDTAATNFSCLVYNAEFMNCTWTIGRAAPSDVQYHLYSQTAKGKQETECTSYIRNSQARHIGCHFDKLKEFKGQAYFLINGTSKNVKIKNFCSEKIFLLHIEKYNPPSNITVNCSKSNCLIQWQKPKTRIKFGDSEWDYQLDIQKEGSLDTYELLKIRGTEKNEYEYPLYDTEAKYILKMRTNHRNENWSDWSKPIVFGGFKEEKINLIYIYVLVGTAIITLFVFFIFKRYYIMQRLFPQIPQIKDKVNICEQLNKQIIWEEFKHPEKCEEIMTIDVIG